MSGTDVAIARCLVRYADHENGGSCYPGVNRLADDSHFAVPTVKRALASLSEAAWIEEVTRGGGRGPGGGRGRHATLYRLIFKGSQRSHEDAGPRDQSDPMKHDQGIREPRPRDQSDPPPSHGTAVQRPALPGGRAAADGTEIAELAARLSGPHREATIAIDALASHHTTDEITTFIIDGESAFDLLDRLARSADDEDRFAWMNEDSNHILDDNVLPTDGELVTCYLTDNHLQIPVLAAGRGNWRNAHIADRFIDPLLYNLGGVSTKSDDQIALMVEAVRQLPAMTSIDDIVATIEARLQPAAPRLLEAAIVSLTSWSRTSTGVSALCCPGKCRSATVI